MQLEYKGGETPLIHSAELILHLKEGGEISHESAFTWQGENLGAEIKTLKDFTQEKIEEWEDFPMLLGYEDIFE
jgi:hypothetical protein